MNYSILRNLSYGMYAIGVNGETKKSACIVNTVFQISSKPAVIAVSLNSSCYTAEQVEKTGRFSVTVLNTSAPREVFTALGFASGYDKDKLAEVEYTVADDLPVITQGMCCYLICKVTEKIQVGDHTVYFAEVTDTSENYEGEPMTYDYYHKVIKGSAPAKAPTFGTFTPESNSDKPQYVCDICGHIYDGEIPFEELSDDWVCPICKMPKSHFKKR
ncbi:MAG: flavin reductase [Acutalibacteraceae bacterium]|nr:flavin reductase [Acutalibacteraceae bacterium]